VVGRLTAPRTGAALALLVGIWLSTAGTERALAAAAGPPARVFALDDEVRVRRADAARAAALGRELGVGGGDAIALTALRGETVAFQVVVVAAPAAPLDRVGVSLSAFAAGDGPGTAARGEPRPRADLFRAHYLTVDARSRNDRRPAESLGWAPGARPADDDVRGEVPDALIPIGLDPTPVMPPPAVPAGRTGALWIDVEVPAATPAGGYVATAVVTAGAATAPTTIARFTVQLQVLPAALPYRATSAFVFYETDRLGLRMGVQDPAERQLWRLLHAHQIDALAPLGSAADVARLRAVYDGTLFAADGYAGAGVGVPPLVVALGAYGMLGAPTPASLARADAMLAALPGPAPPARGIVDVFLYAIDETCASPRAGDWRRALAGRATTRGLLVAQTCNDPVDRQPVDVAMVSAGGFARAMPALARAAGRRAWIYNGVLPHTGTLQLDADPRGLLANGWIAAVMNIERWFYWESIFWSDDNRGGRGAIDPFTTAESFHNGDGDSALGDGLLLYPGRLQGAFAARSLGADGVLPSIRLKMLRRGIQDAGIIALAAREQPAETAAVVARALPAALDEASPERPASWDTAALRFTAARAALRRLITRADPIAPAEIASIFEDLAARRRTAVPLAPAPGPAKNLRARVRGAVAVALGGLVLAALVTAGIRKRRATRS